MLIQMIEDAVVSGYVDLAQLNEGASDAALLQKIAQWDGSELSLSDFLYL